MEDNDATTTYPWAFEVGLEAFEVADESIHREVVVGSSKASVDHNRWVGGRSQRVVRERVGYMSEGLESITPPDTVRAWVCPDGILETSRSDLNVVVGISPATQSAHFVIIEHCRVLSIEGI